MEGHQIIYRVRPNSRKVILDFSLILVLTADPGVDVPFRQLSELHGSEVRRVVSTCCPGPFHCGKHTLARKSAIFIMQRNVQKKERKKQVCGGSRLVLRILPMLKT
jgi:hypothetical protein